MRAVDVFVDEAAAGLLLGLRFFPRAFAPGRLVAAGAVLFMTSDGAIEGPLRDETPTVLPELTLQGAPLLPSRGAEPIRRRRCESSLRATDPFQGVAP